MGVIRERILPTLYLNCLPSTGYKVIADNCGNLFVDKDSSYDPGTDTLTVNKIRVGAGTNDLPSIAYSVDPDTGFAFAPNKIKIITGENVKIDITDTKTTFNSPAEFSSTALFQDTVTFEEAVEFEGGQKFISPVNNAPQVAEAILSILGEANVKTLQVFNNVPDHELDYSNNANHATYQGTPTLADQIVIGDSLGFSFDATDDYLSIPDTDTLTFGDGATDEAFWLYAVINLTDDANNKMVASKWDESAGSQQREWFFQFGGTEGARLALHDESADGTVQATAPSLTTGVPKGVFMYYNGVGGSTAGAGVQIFYADTEQTVTPIDDVNYTAMENTTAPVWIGARESSAGAPERFFAGDIGVFAMGTGTLANPAATATELQAKVALEFYGAT